VEKAGIKAGYSPSYSHTKLYQKVREGKITGIMDNEENVRVKFVKGLQKDVKRFSKEKDNTAYLRAKELISKVQGLQLDRSEVRNISPNEIIIIHDKITRSETPPENRLNDILPTTDSIVSEEAQP